MYRFSIQPVHCLVVATVSAKRCRGGDFQEPSELG